MNHPDTAEAIADTVNQLAQLLTNRGWMLAVAESCTGGMIAAACTDAAGASAWFAGGVVAYANAAKTALLGVPAELIASHGAVSPEVAQAMAMGAKQRLMGSLVENTFIGRAEANQARVTTPAGAATVLFGLSTTGVAGPTGGSTHKPVGTVCFGFCIFGDSTSEQKHFAGNRQQIRQQASAYALAALLKRLR